MPDANGQSHETADFANLHELDAQITAGALRLLSQANDVAVLLVAKIVRHHYPTAHYLELNPSDERPGGVYEGAVFDAAGNALAEFVDDEVGSLEGPDGSTNSVYGILCELDIDLNWRRFVVYPHPSSPLGERVDQNPVLDLQKVLDEEEAIRR